MPKGMVLFFDSQGLRIRKPSLYYHVSSIDEDIEEIMIYGWKKVSNDLVMECYDKDPYKALGNYAHAFYSFALANSGVFEAMLWYNKYESEKLIEATEGLYKFFFEQDDMASRLLMWFEKHIEELDERLMKFSNQVSYQRKLVAYYDSEGRLSQYPSKKPMRMIALTKIADCFEYGKKYTEKQVNEIIKQNISFSDVELIRREMFQLKLIGRLRDGLEYWRE